MIKTHFAFSFIKILILLVSFAGQNQFPEIKTQELARRTDDTFAQYRNHEKTYFYLTSSVQIKKELNQQQPLFFNAPEIHSTNLFSSHYIFFYSELISFYSHSFHIHPRAPPIA